MVIGEFLLLNFSGHHAIIESALEQASKSKVVLPPLCAVMAAKHVLHLLKESSRNQRRVLALIDKGRNSSLAAKGTEVRRKRLLSSQKRRSLYSERLQIFSCAWRNE